MKYILLVKQTVQIIGGKYRKKKIHFPDIADLRPTTNRIRETVFNWLMHDINGANCLDGFAGSGALGFEAISRGAATLTLVEKQPKIYKSLVNTATSFPNENIRVVNTELHKFLATNKSIFDIIFLDPPFNFPFPNQCLNYLIEKQTIAKHGLLYVEYKARVDLDPKIWECLKYKSIGQIIYSLYSKKVP